MTCPICASRDAEILYPDYEGVCITSDMQIVANTVIQNRVCRACGFIFNASGVRGRAEDFYRRAYSLRMHAMGAKNISFSEAKPAPLAELQLTFLSESLHNGSGSLLEVGAGKGEFLSRFVSARPGWQITAIEPSSSAPILGERIPSANIHHGPYATFAARQRFDVIVSLGVIEHVESPVELLAWMGARLSAKGILFLCLPNFEANPNDLFCADHLSKITPRSLEMIAGRAGLKIVRTHSIGVGLMAILRPALATYLGGLFDDTIAVARRNEILARKSVDAIERACSHAGGSGFAIFGLNIAGIFAPFFRGFDPGQIVAYIDENETMHGAVINGRPVVGLPRLHTLGVGYVAIAASPVYHAQIRTKLQPFGVKVYT